MAERLQDKSRYDAAREIVAELRAAGHQAYFAGGCVRDLLLGMEAKDFDVATDASPGQVMGLFAKTVAVGAHFGGGLVGAPQPDGIAMSTEFAPFGHHASTS